MTHSFPTRRSADLVALVAQGDRYVVADDHRQLSPVCVATTRGVGPRHPDVDHSRPLVELCRVEISAPGTATQIRESARGPTYLPQDRKSTRLNSSHQ